MVVVTAVRAERHGEHDDYADSCENEHAGDFLSRVPSASWHYRAVCAWPRSPHARVSMTTVRTDREGSCGLRCKRRATLRDQVGKLFEHVVIGQ